MEDEKRLSQKQRLAGLLISVGINQAEVARIVGVHPNQICRWKKNEAFAQYLAKKMEEIESKVEGTREILIEGAPQAALKIIDLLNSEDETIQIRASSDILDRVGISKTERLEAEVTGQITFRDLIIKAKEDGENE